MSRSKDDMYVYSQGPSKVMACDKMPIKRQTVSNVK